MFINSLKYGSKRFAFTDKGSLHQFFCVEIERLPYDTGFTMTQPFLIKRIIEAANIDITMNHSRPTPVVGPLLSRDNDGPDRKHEWKYRMWTGMLGYLQNALQGQIYQ